MMTGDDMTVTPEDTCLNGWTEDRARSGGTHGGRPEPSEPKSARLA
ncbi:hypothetical protein ACWEBX_17620 [Streptomyces sp. NPDC005070]